MKKIILILLFSFLSIPLFAQSIWWVDTTSAGVERKVYLGDYDSVRTSGGLNFGRLPIKATISGTISAEGIDSLITEIVAANAYLALINSKVSSANKIIVGADSVSTDTLAIDISEITTYAHFSILPNDTIDISFDETNWMRALPSQSFVIKNFSPITFDTIYIKRRGADGTAIFEYEVIGY